MVFENHCYSDKQSGSIVPKLNSRLKHILAGIVKIIHQASFLILKSSKKYLVFCIKKNKNPILKSFFCIR